jgi:hypothetical protein
MQGIRCSPFYSALFGERYALGRGKVTSLSALFDEARDRHDLGANAIWSPSGGGSCPSSIYVRGVGSLETAAMEMDAVARTRPRVKHPVQHYVMSLNEDESQAVSDEQLILVSEHVLDLAGWEGHSALFAVHRDTRNLHCHIIVAAVNSENSRSWDSSMDYHKLHWALRETELKFGMQDEHGLAVVRDPGLVTERIEWASFDERRSWRHARRSAS